MAVSVTSTALLPSFSRKLSAAEINCLKSLADSAAGQEEIIAVQNEDNKRQNSFIANQDAMLAILGEHAANAEGLIASQNKLLALQKDRVANLQKAISDVEQEKLLLAFLSYIAADCIVNVLNEAQCLPSLRAPLWTLKFAIASNLTC